MSHHAYFIAGETEEGISRVYTYIESELGLAPTGNPDVLTMRYGLLSVDDARRIRSLSELSPTVGDTKVIIISASRLFHEAQNVLLKVFEEPSAGTVLMLVIPSEGMLLPTLRSRLLPLPRAEESHTGTASISVSTKEFLDATPVAREKILSKLVDRSKSDKDDEKQAARLAAIELFQSLEQSAYMKYLEASGTAKEELRAFLSDLSHFMPILHERSAPLKLIFEHVLLTMPPMP